MIFPFFYTETAEFDCLHDVGILFTEKLQKIGTEVVLSETKGTMHGYDIMRHASISKESMRRRIDFLKNLLEDKNYTCQ